GLRDGLNISRSGIREAAYGVVSFCSKVEVFDFSSGIKIDEVVKEIQYECEFTLLEVGLILFHVFCEFNLQETGQGPHFLNGLILHAHWELKLRFLRGHDVVCSELAGNLLMVLEPVIMPVKIQVRM